MSRRFFWGAVLLVACAVVPPVAAQSRSEALVTTARQLIAAHDFDNADTALIGALASALYVMDSVHAFVWRGILEYQRGGSISLARLNFRRALRLHPDPGVSGLEALSLALAALYDSEFRAVRVFAARDLDEPARWRVEPVFVYPAALRSRRISGHALVRVIVDTLGRVEERTIDILETPDSAFVDPLKRMLIATPFKPGWIKGRPVKSAASFQFNLTPPAPRDPIRLINAARAQLQRRNADSALALLQEALDSANGATPAGRVYAQLVQGMAWRVKGEDSLSAATFGLALAGYHDLTARGVDLAPVLRTLADSVGRLTARRE